MSNLNFITTYFDDNYLHKGLSLIESIINDDTLSNYQILILYLGDLDLTDLRKIFTNKRIHIINETDLNKYFPRLKIAKLNRTLIEYYFTITPFLIKFTLEQKCEKNSFCFYLDADTFVFKTENRFNSILKTCDIALSPHNFNKIGEKIYIKYGKYNVGLIGVRNNPMGQSFSTWWANSCFDWCKDFVLDGKFADQGYLNDVPKLFNNVKIINELGLIAGPWNISSNKVSSQLNEIYIDGYKLGLFHFHGLKKINNFYSTGELLYGNFTNAIIKNLIYKKYIEIIEKNYKKLSKNFLIVQNNSIRTTTNTKVYYLNKIKKLVHFIVSFIFLQIIYYKKK